MKITALSRVTTLADLRERLGALILEVDGSPFEVRAGYGSTKDDVLAYIPTRAARDAILPLVRKELEKVEQELISRGVELTGPRA